jgi:HEAT repeat protein
MTNWTARIACVYALCVLLYAPAMLADDAPGTVSDAADQEATAKEDALWERAIQDALKLVSQKPGDPAHETKRPQLLLGVDDPEQRLAIYREAIALFSSDPPKALHDDLNELNRRRDTAQQALDYGGAEAMPALIEACKQPNAQLRWIAIDMLQNRGRAALDTLHNLALNDPDGGVRASAVSAIRTIEAPESVPTLIQALKDIDRNVVARAASALGDFRDEVALQPLADALKRKDLRDYGWNWVCSALMEIDADFSRPLVVPYLEKTAKPQDENDENNRQNMLKNAAQPSYPKGLPIGIPKELEGVRMLAADASNLAGESYVEDEIKQLIAHLNNEHYKVAKGCVDALVHLNAKQAVPHLILALQQEPAHANNAHRHARALTAFAAMGDEQAIRGLVKVYRTSMAPESKLSVNRYHIIWSLNELGPVATPLLMRMLEDKLFYTSRVKVRDKVYVTRGHWALEKMAVVLECGNTVNLAAVQGEPVLVDPAAQILSMQAWWSANREAYLAGNPTPPPPEVTSYTARDPLLLR